jgi:NitT/TauT family transport system ATP-binding protein
MSAAIEVTALTKHFKSKGGDVKALERINLSIEHGEFVTVVGASGCGKSSLLRLLAGLDVIDGGSIVANGSRVEGPSVERAMVFQDYSLFPWLTVMGNVTFSRRLEANKTDRLAQERNAEEKRATALLSLMGLEAVSGHYPSQLSGGMRQRVAIARALMSLPAILLMDEPFGALDAQTREVMQELILRVSIREGTTIVFVTHDVEEALFLGSRVVVMSPNPGRIDTIYTVPFPRERSAAIRLDPQFLLLKRAIMERIRETAGLSFDHQTLSSIGAAA